MKNNEFKKFRKRLIMEALLKSFLSGLIVGVLGGTLLAIIFIAFNIIGLWIVILSTLAITIVSGTLFYFLRNKVTTEKIAKRIDRTGLYERTITMLQYQDSESEIINLQRLDAKKQVEKTESKKLELISFKSILTILLVGFILLATSSTILAVNVDSVYSKKHVINFNTHGGSRVPSQIVNAGKKIQVPSNPTSEDYHFMYWYEDNEYLEFDFETLIFSKKVLHARWLEKTNEDKIIDRLIQDLRNIVNRSRVSDELKFDLNALIDKLVINLHYEDTLIAKIAKIEETKQEILARIREEIEKAKEILIGKALMEFDSTYLLGESILKKDSEILKIAISDLIERLTSLSGNDKNKALIGTADDIELALKKATEDNDHLREILQELADYLRSLVEKLEGGDIPEDVADEELEEKLEEIQEELENIFGKENSSTPEEDLEEEIEDAFEDAIDEITGNKPNEGEKPVDPNDSEGGDNKEPDDDKEPIDPEDGDSKPEKPGEGSGPDEEDRSPSIIDGETNYLDYLEQLKADAREKLANPNLTDEERNVLNNYIDMIDAKIEDERN